MSADRTKPYFPDLFREECMSGDYNYLLQTCFAWVRVL